MANWPTLVPLIGRVGRPLVVESLRAWAEVRRGESDVADPEACARWCEARPSKINRASAVYFAASPQ